MMYVPDFCELSRPKNESAMVLWSVMAQASFRIFSDEEAVRRFIERVQELKRVCNHNNRGEKIEFSWQQEPMLMKISCGSEVIADVWFHPVYETTDVLGVESMIDMTVHSKSLIIFDQYLAEKEKGGEA